MTKSTDVAGKPGEFEASGESPPAPLRLASTPSCPRPRSPRRRRASKEATAALQQLQALAAPRRLRVVLDAEGWPLIPGTYGPIEWHDGRDFAVYTDRPRLSQKLWAIPGVRRHQTGDREMRALFPPEAFGWVAAGIRVHRKRGLSPAGARKVGLKTGLQGTSRPGIGPLTADPSEEVGRLEGGRESGQ